MSKLKYEFFKICSPIPLLFMALIFAASIYFAFTGISEYENTIKDLEIDVEMEYRKSNLFVTYDQYSIMGFRVLFRPSPLNIFFFNSNVVQDLESKIDTTEMVKIYNDARGKSVLKKRGSFRDFGGILNVFGSLFMIVMGALTFKNRAPAFKKLEKFFPNVLLRLLILDGFFVLLMGTAFLAAVFRGIDFSAYDAQMYMIFAAATLFFLNFTFCLGVLLSRLFRGNNSGLAAAVAVWAAIVFVVPEIRYISASARDIPSVKELNFKKMTNLMAAEKKIREEVLPMLRDKNRDIGEVRRRQRELAEQYVNEGHRENKAMEERLHNELKAGIREYENVSWLFPSFFQVSLMESVSSKGFDAHLGFAEFVLDMRDRFFIYIFKKRYEPDYRKVEPFIKKGENVYQSRAKLPVNFLPGMLSMLVYSLAALLLSLLLYNRGIHTPGWKRGKEKTGSNFSINPSLLTGSRTFFLYCKEEYRAQGYLQGLKDQEGVCIIEDVTRWGYDPGTSLMCWIRCVCEIRVKEIVDSLEGLGVSGKDLDKRVRRVSREVFKKVYLVLKLCEKKPLNVLLDFFKGESRDFENQCKKFLAQVPGRIFYLSTIPLTRIEPRDKAPESEETKIVAVDLLDESTTLR